MQNKINKTQIKRIDTHHITLKYYKMRSNQSS